jgi:radical SAM-linked protein
MQRLRLKFSRGEELKFLSHLDLMRLWERALRRAGLPLAYSEGFTPHPQIALAAPLAVGVTSQAELMDVFLSRWVPPHSFIAQVKEQLPHGIDLLEAWAVGLNVPSLQSQVRFVEYKVEVETEEKRQEIEKALQSLLSASEIPWHHFRDTGARYYDLRVLVDDLWLIDCYDSLCVLGMRLRCDAKGTGRPEQVTKALGFSQRPKSIHRTEMILS